MHNFSSLFRFSPYKWRVKLSEGCLWIYKHKHIEKVLEQDFLTLFLKSKVLRNLTLILLMGGGGPVGRGKTKPNRWTERNPKLIKNYCATACKNFTNVEKQQMHTNWGPTDPSSITTWFSPSIETRLAVVRGLPTKKFLTKCVNEKSSTKRRS